MSLSRLAELGAIKQLDYANAYHCAYARTVDGRGALVRSMLPCASTACMLTAAWVWLGGDFPATFDIISASHFRTPLYGRKIRTFNRKTAENQRAHTGGLELTTPARTACDIAVFSDTEFDHLNEEKIIGTLMREYRFTPLECLQILDENPFWRNSQRARRFFTALNEHA